MLEKFKHEYRYCFFYLLKRYNLAFYLLNIYSNFQQNLLKTVAVDVYPLSHGHLCPPISHSHQADLPQKNRADLPEGRELQASVKTTTFIQIVYFVFIS